MLSVVHRVYSSLPNEGETFRKNVPYFLLRIETFISHLPHDN